MSDHAQFGASFSYAVPNQTVDLSPTKSQNEPLSASKNHTPFSIPGSGRTEERKEHFSKTHQQQGRSSAQGRLAPSLRSVNSGTMSSNGSQTYSPQQLMTPRRGILSPVSGLSGKSPSNVLANVLGASGHEAPSIRVLGIRSPMHVMLNNQHPESPPKARPFTPSNKTMLDGAQGSPGNAEFPGGRTGSLTGFAPLRSHAGYKGEMLSPRNRLKTTPLRGTSSMALSEPEGTLSSRTEASSARVDLSQSYLSIPELSEDSGSADQEAIQDLYLPLLRSQRPAPAPIQPKDHSIITKDDDVPLQCVYMCARLAILPLELSRASCESFALLLPKLYDEEVAVLVKHSFATAMQLDSNSPHCQPSFQKRVFNFLLATLRVLDAAAKTDLYTRHKVNAAYRVYVQLLCSETAQVFNAFVRYLRAVRPEASTVVGSSGSTGSHTMTPLTTDGVSAEYLHTVRLVQSGDGPAVSLTCVGPAQLSSTLKDIVDMPTDLISLPLRWIAAAGDLLSTDLPRRPDTYAYSIDTVERFLLHFTDEKVHDASQDAQPEPKMTLPRPKLQSLPTVLGSAVPAAPMFVSAGAEPGWTELDSVVLKDEKEHLVMFTRGPAQCHCNDCVEGTASQRLQINHRVDAIAHWLSFLPLPSVFAPAYTAVSGPGFEQSCSQLLGVPYIQIAQWAALLLPAKVRLRQKMPAERARMHPLSAHAQEWVYARVRLQDAVALLVNTGSQKWPVGYSRPRQLTEKLMGHTTTEEITQLTAHKPYMFEHVGLPRTTAIIRGIREATVMRSLLLSDSLALLKKQQTPFHYRLLDRSVIFAWSYWWSFLTLMCVVWLATGRLISDLYSLNEAAFTVLFLFAIAVVGFETITHLDDGSIPTWTVYIDQFILVTSLIDLNIFYSLLTGTELSMAAPSSTFEQPGILASLIFGLTFLRLPLATASLRKLGLHAYRSEWSKRATVEKQVSKFLKPMVGLPISDLPKTEYISGEGHALHSPYAFQSGITPHSSGPTPIFRDESLPRGSVSASRNSILKHTLNPKHPSASTLPPAIVEESDSEESSAVGNLIPVRATQEETWASYNPLASPGLLPSDPLHPDSDRSHSQLDPIPDHQPSLNQQTPPSDFPGYHPWLDSPLVTNRKSALHPVGSDEAWLLARDWSESIRHRLHARTQEAEVVRQRQKNSEHLWKFRSALLDIDKRIDMCAERVVRLVVEDYVEEHMNLRTRTHGDLGMYIFVRGATLIAFLIVIVVAFMTPDPSLWPMYNSLDIIYAHAHSVADGTLPLYTLFDSIRLLEHSSLPIVRLSIDAFQEPVINDVERLSTLKKKNVIRAALVYSKDPGILRPLQTFSVRSMSEGDFINDELAFTPIHDNSTMVTLDHDTGMLEKKGIVGVNSALIAYFDATEAQNGQSEVILILLCGLFLLVLFQGTHSLYSSRKASIEVCREVKELMETAAWCPYSTPQTDRMFQDGTHERTHVHKVAAAIIDGSRRTTGRAGQSLISVGLTFAKDAAHVQQMEQSFRGGERMWGVFGFASVENYSFALTCMNERSALHVRDFMEHICDIVSHASGEVNKHTGPGLLLSFRPRPNPRHACVEKLRRQAKTGAAASEQGTIGALTVGLTRALDEDPGAISDDDGDLPLDAAQALLTSRTVQAGDPQGPFRARCAECGLCCICAQRSCLCPGDAEAGAARIFNDQFSPIALQHSPLSFLPSACLTRVRRTLVYDICEDFADAYGYNLEYRLWRLWKTRRLAEVSAGFTPGESQAANVSRAWMHARDQVEYDTLRSATFSLPHALCPQSLSLSLLFAFRKKRTLSRLTYNRLCAYSSPLQVQMNAARALSAQIRILLMTACALSLEDWGQTLKHATGSAMGVGTGRVAELGVRLGLHCGWALEGPVGTPLHEEPSFLAPTVNLAARVQAATHQFGVSQLVSGNFRDQLPWCLAQRLRLIDCVTMKGSMVPVDLYTFDISLSALAIARAKHLFGVDVEHTALCFTCCRSTGCNCAEETPRDTPPPPHVESEYDLGVDFDNAIAPPNPTQVPQRHSSVAGAEPPLRPGRARTRAYSASRKEPREYSPSPSPERYYECPNTIPIFQRRRARSSHQPKKGLFYVLQRQNPAQDAYILQSVLNQPLTYTLTANAGSPAESPLKLKKPSMKLPSIPNGPYPPPPPIGMTLLNIDSEADDSEDEEDYYDHQALHNRQRAPPPASAFDNLLIAQGKLVAEAVTDFSQLDTEQLAQLFQEIEEELVSLQAPLAPGVIAHTAPRQRKPQWLFVSGVPLAKRTPRIDSLSQSNFELRKVYCNPAQKFILKARPQVLLGIDVDTGTYLPADLQRLSKVRWPPRYHSATQRACNQCGQTVIPPVYPMAFRSKYCQLGDTALPSRTICLCEECEIDRHAILMGKRPEGLAAGEYCESHICLSSGSDSSSRSSQLRRTMAPLENNPPNPHICFDSYSVVSSEFDPVFVPRLQREEHAAKARKGRQDRAAQRHQQMNQTVDAGGMGDTATGATNDSDDDEWDQATDDFVMGEHTVPPVQPSHVHNASCPEPCLEHVSAAIEAVLANVMEDINMSRKGPMPVDRCRCALHSTGACTKPILSSDMTPEEAEEMNGMVDFLSAMQQGMPPRFIAVANKAVAAYIAGHWTTSKTLINKALDMVPQDQSLKMIRSEMEPFNFQAPQEWSGYRALLKK